MTFDRRAEERIVKECLRAKIPLPESIADSPEIPVGMGFYLEAFNDLTSHRQLGFGEGPIPTLAILEYGRFYGCDDEDLEDLVFFVRRLDNVYLEHQAAKAKKAKPKRKSNGKRS